MTSKSNPSGSPQQSLHPAAPSRLAGLRSGSGARPPRGGRPASRSEEKPVGHGRTSVVYPYGEGMVVKVYPSDEDIAGIQQEAEAAQLVDRLGVPTVHCYGVIDYQGSPGVVFERLSGPDLATVAEKHILGLPGICRQLAAAHLRMHAARTQELPDVRHLAEELLGTAPFGGLTDGEKARIRRYLRSLPQGDRVLHLDYHPQNIFVHNGGHAIIDWHTAARGDAAADVAMSVVLMREVELFPGTPPLRKLLFAVSRLIILFFYRRAYLAAGTLTRADVNRWITCARILRLGLLDVPSERTRLLRRIRRATRKDNS